MTLLLLATVTAADGAARGVSLLVVIVAGLAVYLIARPQIRRERETQRAVDDAARRAAARQAMDRASQAASEEARP